jgi:hypothetical protein
VKSSCSGGDSPPRSERPSHVSKGLLHTRRSVRVQREEGLLAPLAILSDQRTRCSYMTSFTCFTVRVFLPPSAVATVPVASTFFPTMAETFLPFSM